jgi:secreted trypsin-like serine protease
VLGIPYDELRIAAHRHNLSTSSEQENGIILQVKKITVHPNFNHFTLDNDIAVWELEGGDQMPANRSVRLDNGKNSFPGRNGTVLGWGDIEEGGDTSEVLRELSVTMLSNERCRSMLGPVITDGMLCAGGEEGRDACQGGKGTVKLSLKYCIIK